MQDEQRELPAAAAAEEEAIKATGAASDHNHQGESTSSASSSSGDNNDEYRRAIAAGTKPNSSSKGYNLIEQLYPSNANSEQQEQLLLTEQGSHDDKDKRSTRPKYLTSRLFIIGKKSRPLEMGSKGADCGDESTKQSAKTKVMKVSRNGQNNDKNTQNGRSRRGHNTNGSTGDDLESNLKLDAASSPKSSCSKSKCLLKLLMGLILILAVVLILFLSVPKILDHRDGCSPMNSPFLQTTNKLYATKTLYSTTLNYLSKSPLVSTDNNPLALAYSDSSLGSNGLNRFDLPSSTTTNINLDKSSISIPDIFSPSDSLETLHKKLISRGCRHDSLLFYGRHAARLPNSDQISRISKTIESIKSRIVPINVQKLSPLSLSTTSTGINEVTSEQQSFILTQGPPPSFPQAQGNKSELPCVDPLVQYKQWSFFAEPEQGNLLMETGGREAQAMARRFKSLFPDMFDASKTNITFGTSKEMRTAQTAVNFLKQMDNLILDGTSCQINDYPTESTADKNQGNAILEDRCLTEFLKISAKEQLYLHDTCAKYQQKPIIKHNFGLKEAKHTEFIAQSVSEKLKLTTNANQLTSEEAKAIYDVCRYESALTGATSIWCNLFSERDLKFYEYLADIEDYYNSAYGHPNLMKSVCPITTDLTNRLDSRELLRKKEPGERGKSEARYYFTHSEVIQRMIAALVDLTKIKREDKDYSPESIRYHLAHGTAPKNRRWQTSLFTPFSANIAFNLYDCPSKRPGSKSNPPEMDLEIAGFRVVTSLNEQPIQIAGCNSYVCDYNTVKFHSRFIKETPSDWSCKLEDICEGEPTIVT